MPSVRQTDDGDGDEVLSENSIIIGGVKILVYSFFFIFHIFAFFIHKQNH